MRYAFAKSVGFGLYKLGAGGNRFSAKKAVSMLPCVATKSVPATGTDGETTIKLQITEAGNYALVPILNGKVQRNADVEEILCTPFLPVNINGCTTNAVFAADYMSGAPLADVGVTYRKEGRKVTTLNLGKTDKHGMLAYTAPEPTSYWGDYLQFSYNNLVYKFDERIRANKYTKREDKEPRYSISILTDRNLYHPGDSISWAVAVAVREPGKEPAVAPGMKLFVELLNANSKKVGSQEITTDALGRAIGVFATEKGTLTGNYRIQVKEVANVMASSSVMVSDFKLPTFEAEFTSVERDVPTPGAVRLTGKARTYSGMPVIGAKVDVTIEGASRWRWFAPEGQELVSTEVTTDAAGVFTVDISAADLDKKNYEGEKFQNFIALAVVTSATAETSECSKNFTTGKPYVLARRPSN